MDTGSAEDSYSKFVKNLEIKEFAIKDLNLKRYFDLEKDKSKFKGGLNFTLSETTYEVINERIFKYLIDLEVNGTTENEEDTFIIEITFEVYYGLQEGVESLEDNIEKFTNTAIFNSWPFIRESIHDLSDRMGLKLPKLPLLLPSDKKT